VKLLRTCLMVATGFSLTTAGGSLGGSPDVGGKGSPTWPIAMSASAGDTHQSLGVFNMRKNSMTANRRQQGLRIQRDPQLENVSKGEKAKAKAIS